MIGEAICEEGVARDVWIVRSHRQSRGNLSQSPCASSLAARRSSMPRPKHNAGEDIAFRTLLRVVLRHKSTHRSGLPCVRYTPPTNRLGVVGVVHGSGAAIRELRRWPRRSAPRPRAGRWRSTEWPSCRAARVAGARLARAGSMISSAHAQRLVLFDQRCRQMPRMSRSSLAVSRSSWVGGPSKSGA